MTKKQITLIILLSLIFGAAGSFIFTRYVIPKLNSVEWLVKHNLAPSAGPLVIHTREEIRVNEGSDTIAAVQKAKPWLVGIITGSDSTTAQIKTSGLILTADGIVVTTKDALPQDNTQYISVSFVDGKVLKGVVKAQDPDSDLILIKVDGANLPTASLGYPKDLQLGQRMIVMSSQLGQYQATDMVSYISSELRNTNYSQVFSTEHINRTFVIDNLKDVPEGSVAISADGNIQGIYSHSSIISADAIKSGLNQYFQTGAIIRNSFGFYFQYISKAGSNLFSTSEGVIIKKPDSKTPAIIAGSPAQAAGLQENDIITKVDDTQINFDNSLDEIFATHIPGDTIKFEIIRAGQTKTISLLIGAKK